MFVARTGDIRPPLHTKHTNGERNGAAGGLGDPPAAGFEGDRCMTSCDALIRHVARDEALTRGLGDIEARMLIEWLANWAELLADAARNEEDAWACVERLCRRGRAIGRFVQLWNDPFDRVAAIQLAASERFDWPLPTGYMDPGDLMHHILTWENQQPGA